MGDGYWRIETVAPQTPGDNRCIYLHGKEEEIVGPMTAELAEAWIAYFSQRRELAPDSAVDLSQLGQAPLGQAPLGQAPLGQAPIREQRS